jgi:hypothetical protein
MTRPLKSRAVIGDDNAAELLRSAGIQSIQSRAAKIPVKNRRAKNNKSTMRALKKMNGELDLENTGLNLLRYASKCDFKDYWESVEFFKTQHLKPVMPTVPVLRFNKALYEIWRWVDGRAWIAGSAALWAADAEADWMYGDIDIFCKSIEFYEDLKAELKEIKYMGFSKADETGEYNTKFSNHPFIHQMGKHSWGAPIATPSLCLIAPVGKDWSTIENILLGFDLSICAVAIMNPRTLYAYSPQDIRHRRTDTICIEFPLRTLKRLFKYIQRGYSPSWDLAESLAGDNRFDDAFEVLQMTAEYTEHKGLHRLVERYLEAKNWMYAFEGDEDYHEEDEEDDGYHYS